MRYADDTVEHLPTITFPGRWVNRAACAGLPSDWFFPDRGQATKAHLQAVCASCPVTAECLQWAVENKIQHGIWGGASYRARRKLRAATGPCAGE